MTTASSTLRGFLTQFVFVPWLLWVVFGILSAAFIAHYIILNYHWRQYAFPDKWLSRMHQAYIIGAIAFIALMLYAIMNAYV